MGASKEEYEAKAPYKSFIHVDDFDGPADLAEYLKKLDADDTLYNSYFQWKGTGEMINTKFFCRLCALLHDPKVGLLNIIIQLAYLLNITKMIFNYYFYRKDLLKINLSRTSTNGGEEEALV